MSERRISNFFLIFQLKYVFSFNLYSELKDIYYILSISPLISPMLNMFKLTRIRISIFYSCFTILFQISHPSVSFKFCPTFSHHLSSHHHLPLFPLISIQYSHLIHHLNKNRLLSKLKNRTLFVQKKIYINHCFAGVGKLIIHTIARNFTYFTNTKHIFFIISTYLLYLY